MLCIGEWAGAGRADGETAGKRNGQRVYSRSPPVEKNTIRTYALLCTRTPTSTSTIIRKKRNVGRLKAVGSGERRQRFY